MSTLRSAVDELAEEDLRWVPDDRLADGLADIRAGIEALEGQWLRRLGEFDRRGAWEADGHLSAAGWLRDRLRMGAPGRRVATARALSEMPGARAALRDRRGGVIAPEAAHRLACDAGVTRVIVGPGSEPLDVGRRARTIPAGIRRALVVRDGGCVFPGCDRPPEWCDAHHVVPWVRGGRTSLDNLVLLCRRHHRAVHEGGFHLEIVEGRPRIRRPDGSAVRGPPKMSYPRDTVLADADQGGRRC